MRRLVTVILLLLGVFPSAAPSAAASVAASAENRAAGSATVIEKLIGLETRLSEDAVRENLSLAYDLASDDAVAASGIDRARQALPVLDRTGKVHGPLPRPENLGRYSRDELTQLQRDLRSSVQERIRRTSELGPDRAHGQRQAAEQQLIHQIDKLLGGS